LKLSCPNVLRILRDACDSQLKKPAKTTVCPQMWMLFPRYPEAMPPGPAVGRPDGKLRIEPGISMLRREIPGSLLPERPGMTAAAIARR